MRHAGKLGAEAAVDLLLLAIGAAIAYISWGYGFGSIARPGPGLYPFFVGSAIGDNVRNDMPHGIVRAFDARTGAQVWSWDPIPAALADKTGWTYKDVAHGARGDIPEATLAGRRTQVLAPPAQATLLSIAPNVR